MTFGLLGAEAGLGALPIPPGLLSAAEAVADWLGMDLDDLVEQGVDALLSIIGIGTCSDENKRKYRGMVANGTPAQLEQWLRARRVGGATDECNKYALALAAKRAADIVPGGKTRDRTNDVDTVRAAYLRSQDELRQARNDAALWRSRHNRLLIELEEAKKVFSPWLAFLLGAGVGGVAGTTLGGSEG